MQENLTDSSQTKNSSRMIFLGTAFLAIAGIAFFLGRASNSETFRTAQVAQPTPPSSRTSPVLIQEGPVIGYHRSGSGGMDQVRGARCLDSSCSGSVLFSPGSGAFVAATLPADRLPFLVYTSGPSGPGYPNPYNLISSKCVDTMCNTFQTNTLDGGTISPNKSVAYLSDGRPVITYQLIRPDSIRQLMLLVCRDISCATGRKTVIEEKAGYYSSVAVGPDNIPVIVYSKQNSTPQNSQLKLVKCTTSECVNLKDPVIIDGNVNETNLFPSIAVSPVTGSPAVSYTTTFRLKVAVCADSYCTTGTVITPIAPSSNTQRSSIVVTPDGNPVISFYDRSQLAIRVAKCTSSDCVQNQIITVIESGDVGETHTSITADPANGNPFVAYNKGGTVRTAYCTDQSCTTSNPPRTQDSPASIPVSTDG